MILLPEGVSYILEKLEKNGFEAYIVGGCVRDSLMGKNPHDFDITTSAAPQEIKALFKKTYDTGLKHGTVTVAAGKEHFEVTTFRIDGRYKDGRHPEQVSFTKNIEEDLSRRDFTMNAIAYNPRAGLIDLFGGAEDIGNKIIRGVGEPTLRFQEDALRMLRALRAASQLGFSVEPLTWAAITQNAALIQAISRERIQAEFVKMLLSEEPAKISLIYESGLLAYIIKESEGYVKKYGTVILRDIERSNSDINERLAVLFRHLPEEKAWDLLTDLKFDNKTRKTACLLIRHADDEIAAEPWKVRKAASALSAESFRKLLNFKRTIEPEAAFLFDLAEERLERVLQNGDCLSLKDLAIRGDDLKRMGITDGPAIGRLLNEMLEIVLMEPSKNDFEALISTIFLD